MIYLNNNTDNQTMFIPRSSVSGKETIEVVKGYEEGFNEGYNEGQETQKDKLLNLYVTENGVYNREDGYGTITVDVLANGGGLTDEEKENINTAFEDLYNKYDGLQESVSEVDEKVNTSIEGINTDITEITGTIEGINTTLDDIQENYLQKDNLKTVNGNVLIGEGDIFIESEGAKIIELTQEEYDNLWDKENDTLFVITDAPVLDVPDTSNFATKTELNNKQDELVSGINIKTINGESILGEGNITIEGGSGGGEIPEGVKPTYYLWKEMSSNGSFTMLNHNKNMRNILLTYKSSEEYPIVILKDYYNNTISNNLYIGYNYVEIQCCNSRVSGQSTDLIDERYELTADGWLKEVKKETVASQNWVNDKLGDIESILNNIIGQE